MFDTVNKFIKIMEPLVDNIEDDYQVLMKKKEYLKKLDEMLLEINGDSYNILKINCNTLIELINFSGSNEAEYNANKYILSANIEEMKHMPQYIKSKEYIDEFYKYINNHYAAVNEEYQKIECEYQNKVLINKYYTMFSNSDVFVENDDEIQRLFELLKIEKNEKNEILIYILKENNKTYSLLNINDEFSEMENKKALDIIENNKKFENNEYDELLEAVSEYVDISKNIDDIINYELINKINILNILLAKKIWLFRKIRFLYYNMNCKKCNNIISEFEDICNLYEKVKDIKEQSEVVRIIKGENYEG